MAIQSSFYSGTALDSRTFPTTKHIATKAHMAIWRQQISDDVWVQMNIADYQLINNSCVLNTPLSQTLYKQLEVRVGDTPDELLPSISDIAKVAGIDAEIVKVAGIDAEIVKVAGVDTEVVSVAGITTEIVDVASEPLRQSILDAEDNADSAETSASAAAASAQSVIDKLHTVNTIADMLLLNTSEHTNVNVLGYSFINDGGGGIFYFDAISEETSDGGTIFGTGIGRWKRVYIGAINVKWFGAQGDGITDDTTSISNAKLVAEELIICKGIYLLSNITFDIPIYFDVGGAFKVDAGQTITIPQSITSSKQFIFQGDGIYTIGHDGDSGEDARELHASWFGAFPSPTHGTDQAPMINKAFASVGNGRESIVQFDIGNYNISSQIQVTRGGWVKGAGTRRTVFKLDTDGFDVFTTTEQACKFTEIQFELHTGIISDRVNGAYIAIEHNDCVIKDVATTMSKNSIIINGNGCIVDDVFCLYSDNNDIGSSIIEVNGSNASIRNIKMNSSTFGTESVINIGENAVSTISGITIENVKSISPSQVIRINAKNASISRVILKDIMYNGYAGVNPDWIIKLINSLGNDIDKINIDGIVGSSYINGCISIESVVNTIQDITINNVNFQSTNGIELRETSGTLKEVFIGASVNINDCTNPFIKVGTPTEIKISPSAMYPTVNPSYSYDATIADDGVYSVDLGTNIYTGTIIVTAGYTNYGLFSIRAAGSPANIIITSSANMAAATGVLTGTTGTDGKITVSTDDNGLIYVENRSGGSQRVCITVNVGII